MALAPDAGQFSSLFEYLTIKKRLNVKKGMDEDN
jgi:hypothetical protein